MAGSTVWQAPDLLVFTSDEPLPGSTQFQVRLRTPIQTFDGSRLDKPLDWMFQTARLHIDDVDHVNLAPRQPVRLTFNQAVDPQALKAATRILAAGRAVPFAVSNKGPIDSLDDDEDRVGSLPDHHLWLVPQPAWPWDTTLDVRVSPTLRPKVGSLPMGQAWHTRLGAAAAPVIDKVTCDEGDGRVTVTLNTTLDSDESQSLIATPALSFHADDINTLAAQGVPGTRYAIRLSPTARNEDDQAPKHTPTRTVTCSYPRPGLALSSDGGVFAPGQAPVVGVRSRGLQAVKIRTAVLDETALLRTGFPDRGSLPAQLNWQEHVLVLRPRGPTQFAGTPVDLGPQLTGPRLPVLVSAEPQGVGPNWPNRRVDDWREPRVGVYQKTNLAVTAVTSEVHEIVQVVSMDTAQPVAGAQVKLLDGGRAISLGQTDANGIQSGIATQRIFSSRADRTWLMVTSPDGRDHAVTDVAERFGRQEGNRVLSARGGVKLRPFEMVTGALVLDRDVFQTGEKVRLAGWLAISSPYEASGVRAVPAGSLVDVTLDRPAGPSLKQTLTVSAEGKLWGEMPLPENWLGRYSLNASLHAHCSPSAEEDPAELDENEQEACGWRTRMRPALLAVKKFRNSEFYVEAKDAGSIQAQHARIELALASSLLGSLDGALADLIVYPHTCLEQTASRLVSLLLLREQAQAHLPPGQTVNAVIARLVQRIHDLYIDHWTGFATWPGQKERSPFSGYATLVLVLAHKAGLDDAAYRVVNPAGDLFGFERMKDCASRLDECAMTLLAAAEASHRSGDFVAINTLFERRWNSLPPHVQALVLLAQARLGGSRIAKLAADLAARTVDLGNTAHVNLDADWSSSFFFSHASVDAVVLWALVRAAPHHPIVAKLVRGLMDARPGAAWATTQENAFALLALTEYAKKMEATPPDFTVHSWVGLDRQPEVAFTKAEAAPHLTSATVTAPVDVTLERTGRGRLYYSVALAYEDSAVDTVARGLSLQRQLRSADASLHAGEVVALDIVVRNAVPLRQIAVDVPLPGGMDAIDIDLTSPAALPVHGARSPWFTHQELHPQRALLFADSLPAGQHHHTVFLRALVPGRYVLPAAHAEAMYAPDINGRTDTAQIRIEPAR